MLKSHKYYIDKAETFNNDSNLAVSEVNRLLNTINLQDIKLVKQNTNTQNRTNILIELGDNKVYHTQKMNKQTYRLFLNLLPLHKSDKLETPVITKGLLDGIDSDTKIFKNFK